MSRHDDRVPMLHMLDFAREAVEIASGRTVDDLQNDRLRSLALTHLLELVGEAANRVTPETRARYPAVPWRKVISLRNRLIHGYDTLDPHIVLRVANSEYPSLIDQLEYALNSSAADGNTSTVHQPDKS